MDSFDYPTVDEVTPMDIIIQGVSMLCHFHFGVDGHMIA